MTKRVGQAEVANWHYKNDPTHVAFFSDDTLPARRHWAAELRMIGADVALLKAGREVGGLRPGACRIDDSMHALSSRMCICMIYISSHYDVGSLPARWRQYASGRFRMPRVIW